MIKVKLLRVIVLLLNIVILGKQFYTIAPALKVICFELIKKVQQPFFWIHGMDDHFLAIETQGEPVYKNYRGTYKEAHRIFGAGHSNVPNTFGFPFYLKAVGDFIAR